MTVLAWLERKMLWPISDVSCRLMFIRRDIVGERATQFTPSGRPAEIATIHALLCPLAEIIVRMPALMETDPMLTAIK